MRRARRSSSTSLRECSRAACCSALFSTRFRLSHLVTAGVCRKGWCEGAAGLACTRAATHSLKARSQSSRLRSRWPQSSSSFFTSISRLSLCCCCCFLCSHSLKDSCGSQGSFWENNSQTALKQWLFNDRKDALELQSCFRAAGGDSGLSYLRARPLHLLGSEDPFLLLELLLLLHQPGLEGHLILLPLLLLFLTFPLLRLQLKSCALRAAQTRRGGPLWYLSGQLRPPLLALLQQLLLLGRQGEGGHIVCPRCRLHPPPLAASLAVRC